MKNSDKFVYLSKFDTHDAQNPHIIAQEALSIFKSFSSDEYLPISSRIILNCTISVDIDLFSSFLECVSSDNGKRLILWDLCEHVNNVTNLKPVIKIISKFHYKKNKLDAFEFFSLGKINNKYYCRDIAELLELFDQNKRLKILKLFNGKINDNNFSVITKLFAFRDKNKVNKVLSKNKIIKPILFDSESESDRDDVTKPNIEIAISDSDSDSIASHNKFILDIDSDSSLEELLLQARNIMDNNFENKRKWSEIEDDGRFEKRKCVRKLVY